ncbi:MAG: glycoside hydrolase family 26 protein [Tannerellaceae bacterium]|jgi:mannan endo-1,4-beta-mannosidase|nr:glycoside hydrolase family 26 protein [Tannerellaceae bacterium]
MRLVYSIILILLTGMTCAKAQVYRPADPASTPGAKALFTRLIALQDKGVMYGHQDDLMYGTTWWYQKDSSDIKASTGDYPAVVGFELGEIERGGERSLDSVSFAQITEQVKFFHDKKGVITVSWHCINPITSQLPGAKTANGPGSAWDVPKKDDPVRNRGEVKSILPGGANHAMFNGWLTTLSDYFLTWRDGKGELIPFLFRPYHEHSGDFFWWGNTRCTPSEYAALWRYTVDFMRKKGLHNILYIYNTDKVYSLDEYMTGYPGDEYIDMLAIDWYGSGADFNAAVDKALSFVSTEAIKRQKPAALSECGNISWDMVNIMRRYKLSYFLTWRNRYTPDPARRRPSNSDLLKSMYNDPHTLFLNDIQQ